MELKWVRAGKPRWPQLKWLDWPLRLADRDKGRFERMQGGRKKSREILFRVLFEVDLSGEDLLESLEYSLARYHLTEDGRDHTMRVAEEAAESMEAIDESIQVRLHRWDLSRLSAVVRSVLRLATAELRVASDVATAVILDEAIQLARRYGEDKADRFVNGVLDRVAADVRTETSFDQQEI